MGETSNSLGNFSMDPINAIMKVDNSGVTVKNEPIDTSDDNSNVACPTRHHIPIYPVQATVGLSANNNPGDVTPTDHSVSFTELDQLLNCDMTFYEELQMSGLVKQEPVTISDPNVGKCEELPNMDYDSDNESNHSDSDCSDVICSESFNEVQSEIVRQVKNDIRLASTILDLPPGEYDDTLISTASIFLSKS